MKSPRFCSALVAVAALIGPMIASCARAADRAAAVDGPDDIFGLTNLWSFHLILEAQAWDAMEPKDFRMAGPPPRGAAGPPGPDGGRPVHENQFPFARAALEFQGQTFDNIGLRFKGNSSFRAARDSLKRSLKLDFTHFEKKLRFHGLTRLNLNNNAMDPSQMREALAYEVFRQAGVPAPRTAFVRVYLTLAGRCDHQYVGLYTLVEQVDEQFLKDRFGTKKGLLLKPDLPPGLAFLGEDWDAYQERYDPKTTGTPADRERLIAFTRLLNQADDTEFRARLEKFIDPTACLRFFAVQAAVANLDGPLFIGHNFYLYLNPGDNRFTFLPWDLNEAFGGFIGAGPPAEQMNLSITQPYSNGNRLLERLLADSSLRAVFRQQFASLLENAFNRERVLSNLTVIAAIVRPAVSQDRHADFAQFERSLTATNIMDTGPRGGMSRGQPGPEDGPLGPGPGGFPGLRTPKAPLHAFIVGRVASIRSQLDGATEGHVPRGRGFGPPGGFAAGPGVQLAPAILRLADTDHDQRASALEFQTLFERWFREWDTDPKGGIDERKIVAGLRPLVEAQFREPGPPGVPREPPPPPGSAPAEPLERPAREAPSATAPPAFRPGPGGPGRPLPVFIFARQIAQAADADRDGSISGDEWRAAAAKWFGTWDRDKNEVLDLRELGAGLNDLIGPPRGRGGPRGLPGGGAPPP